MKKIMAIFILVLMGCNTNGDQKNDPWISYNCGTLHDSLPWNTNCYFQQGATWNGKRVYYIHGLGHDHTMLGLPIYNYYLTTLLSLGYQVVTFDIVNAKNNAAIKATELFDDGSFYQASWKARLTDIVDYTDRILGKADKSFLTGISWGGLHTLMGAALVPKFTAYAAIHPLIEVSQYSYFSGISIPQFNPENELGALEGMPGYITWDLLDQDVGYTEAENLACKLSHSVDGVETNQYGHGASIPIFQSVIAYIEAQ